MVKLAEPWGKGKLSNGFCLLLDGNGRAVNNNVGKAEELNNYFWSAFGEEPNDTRISYDDDDDEIHSITTDTEEDVKQKLIKLGISRSR